MAGTEARPTIVSYPHIRPGWTGSVDGTCWAMKGFTPPLPAEGLSVEELGRLIGGKGWERFEGAATAATATAAGALHA